MKKALLPFLAALLVVGGGLFMVGPDSTSAHRPDCPSPRPTPGHARDSAAVVQFKSNGSQDEGGHDKGHKQQKHKKHDKRNCGRDRPTPTPPAGEFTPMPTPGNNPTPQPTPTPTVAPAPTPSPTPGEGPPIVTAAPTPTSAPTPAPSPAPSPAPGADVKVQGVTVTVPPATTTGVPFLLTAAASLHNNGPDGDVNVDTTFNLALPQDCTVTSGTTAVALNRSAPMSVPVSVSRAWNVTCAQAGPHQFTVTASIAISGGQALSDPNLANNSGSGSGTTMVN